MLGVPLLRLELGGLRGHEGPELRLLQGLREAERAAPCVLWLDEIDHAVRGAADRAENHGLIGTLASWLQERKGGVFVAATANAAQALPPELGRKGRFDEIFFVDLPQAAERREILQVHLGAAGQRKPMELEPVVEATARFTGAELAAVVHEAVVESSVAGRDIDAGDHAAAEAAMADAGILELFES